MTRMVMTTMVMMAKQELELRARLTQSSLHHCPPMMCFNNDDDNDDEEDDVADDYSGGGVSTNTLAKPFD